MLKVGNVYYSLQNDSKWLIWHEIKEIKNNIVTLWNYGHDTESFSSSFYVNEMKFMIRKGMLKEA